MKPIGFTVVSNDDFWQEKAHGLRQNLVDKGLDLEICTLAVGRCTKHEEKYSYYHMKDSAFIDFAREAKRCVWLLDAEVRFVGQIPDKWLEGRSVIFHKDIPPKLKDERSCYMDTGESIFDPASALAYKSAMDMALEAAKRGGQYDVEAYLHLTMDDSFIKETIAMDRRKANISARASRGSWHEDNTVIVHPYDHNWQMSLISSEAGIEIHRLSSRDFINHFSPSDKILACKVSNLLDSNISVNDRWLSLPLTKFAGGGYVKQLCDMLPLSLPRIYSKLRHPCYLIADWIICPSLKLLANRQEWNQRAYFLD